MLDLEVLDYQVGGENRSWAGWALIKRMSVGKIVLKDVDFGLFSLNMEISYRSADNSDLNSICEFVDFWLTGGGKADGIPGAGHDFFIPHGRQADYLRKYKVMLAIESGKIVGWAVTTKKNVLIHLLIAATFRGQSIGSELLKRMDPEVIRSKFDQSTGDPGPFYRKHGFVKAVPERLGKKGNIEIYAKVGSENKARELYKKRNIPETKKPVDKGEKLSCTPQRTIDVLAKRFPKTVFRGD